MPAKSKAQQIAMAIAEHHPEKLNPENEELKEMTHQQLHDFASTPRKHLPEHVSHEHSHASYKMAHDARKNKE